MSTVAEAIGKIESLFFDEDIVGGIVEERKALREGLAHFANAILAEAELKTVQKIRDMVYASHLKQ